MCLDLEVCHFDVIDVSIIGQMVNIQQRYLLANRTVS